MQLALAGFLLCVLVQRARAGSLLVLAWDPDHDQQRVFDKAQTQFNGRVEIVMIEPRADLIDLEYQCIGDNAFVCSLLSGQILSEEEEKRFQYLAYVAPGSYFNVGNALKFLDSAKLKDFMIIHPEHKWDDKISEPAIVLDYTAAEKTIGLLASTNGKIVELPTLFRILQELQDAGTEVVKSPNLALSIPKSACDLFNCIAVSRQDDNTPFQVSLMWKRSSDECKVEEAKKRKANLEDNGFDCHCS